MKRKFKRRRGGSDHEEMTEKHHGCPCDVALPSESGKIFHNFTSTDEFLDKTHNNRTSPAPLAKCPYIPSAAVNACELTVNRPSQFRQKG